MATAGELTYLSYLKVPELLELQQPMSDPEHPDELQFIVVHQAAELWFKLMLHDLERVVQAFEADDLFTVCRVMRRVNNVVDLVVGGLRALEDLPAWSLHEFRGYLGTASGLQSLQFRELELLGGLRDPSHRKILERASGDGGLPPALARRLEQTSLADAHQAAARRAGIGSWEDVYVHAADHAQFYFATEALMDFDRGFVRWRRAHVGLLERILGPRTRGTAGMALSYLVRTVDYRFFPYLWDVRHELAVRGGGELVEPILARQAAAREAAEVER
jgi:tryptophan 2,3-dioxygenase